MAKSRQPYEFDVAISFAGEERRYAKLLAESLRDQGLSVFYDEHHKPRLWGKDEREFERIYGPLSRFVALFISKNYVRKTWPRFEFETALREEGGRDSESILPIRVDNARLPGLHDGRFYLSLRENSIDEIAACLIEKCKQAKEPAMPNPKGKSGLTTKHKVAILSGEAKHVLGIIVVSQLPLPLGLFKNLFPDMDWKTQCGTLRKHGLLSGTDSHLKPSPSAVKAIGSDEVERKVCVDRWAKRLEELKDHSDIALYLSIHYVNAERWDDAVVTLADIANNGLHGHTNQTYFGILKRFTTKKVLRRLKPLSRIKLFHALAICATQEDQFQDALTWFEKVRGETVRAGDTHWLGQYFINSGVALDLSGDIKKAITALQKAIDHGKNHNEPSIVGRSLGNLAQIRMRENEPDAAIELMRQSTEWKRKAGDDFGSATSAAQLGSIEANRGNLRPALKHFSEAEALFAAQGMTYEQAKTAFTIGNVYVDLGQHGNALKAYRRARRLTEDDEYLELRLLAIQGIGRASHALGRFDEIEREFNVLLNAPTTAGHDECKLTAYHGLGIAQMFQGRPDEGRVNLKRVLQLARRLDRPEWAVKALVNMAGRFEGGSFHPAAPSDLARLAALEARRERWLTAARLWDMAGDGFARSRETTKAESAFSSATEYYENGSEAPEKVIASVFKLYAWRWHFGLFEKALDALEKAETLAGASGSEGDRVKAIDERGLAYQKLGRIREALSLHQKAVRLAREHDLPTQIRISLNNHGQALRRLRRFDEAVTLFQESESFSRRVDDIEDALGTMVNRGLTLEESGDARGAAVLLKKCRDEAKRRDLSRQHVMALEALGNLAWHRGRLEDAEKLYRDGLGVAKQKRMKESEAEIAVNLASLWEKKGKTKQALKLLQPLATQFDGMPEAHVCHEVLAGLYYANGDYEGAQKHWELGRAFALAIGNKDYVALCSSNLADIYFEKKDFAAAEKELETAVANEPDPELQVPLLTQLFRVQLALKNEERAQSLFKQINKVADAKKFHDVIIDIYVHLGDFEWRGDKKSKLNALKAYLVAIVQTLSHLGPKATPTLIGHIVSNLTNPHNAPTEAEFDSLLHDLRTVLPQPTKGNQGAVRLIMWPFDTARRLLPFVGDQGRFAEEVRKAARDGFVT